MGPKPIWSWKVVGIWWSILYRTIRQQLVLSLVVVLLAVQIVLIVLVILGYIFQWGWVGVNTTTQVSSTIKTSPNSTVTNTFQMISLWNWFQLLVIPAVIAIAGYLYNYTSSRNEREANKQRDDTQRELAEDDQREAALQAYIDRMSELLLLEEGLGESQPGAKVRKIARVRTLTVLDRLDGWRKRIVLQILYESGLIDKGNRIVDLTGAVVANTDLKYINLKNADLSGAIFSGADLLGADFSGSDLQKAHFGDVNIQGTKFIGANLKGASIGGWDENQHSFDVDPFFVGADFSRADLSGATINEYALTGAKLNDAVFDGTRLFLVDLSSCNITPEQEQKAILIDNEAYLQSISARMKTYREFLKPIEDKGSREGGSA